MEDFARIVSETLIELATLVLLGGGPPTVNLVTGRGHENEFTWALTALADHERAYAPYLNRLLSHQLQVLVHVPAYRAKALGIIRARHEDAPPVVVAEVVADAPPVKPKTKRVAPAAAGASLAES